MWTTHRQVLARQPACASPLLSLGEPLAWRMTLSEPAVKKTVHRRNQGARPESRSPEKARRRLVRVGIPGGSNGGFGPLLKLDIPPLF